MLTGLSNTVSSAGGFLEGAAKFTSNIGKVANLGKVTKFADGVLDKIPGVSIAAQGIKAAGATVNAVNNIMNGQGANIEDSTLLKIADSVGTFFGNADAVDNWVSNSKAGKVLSNIIVAGEEIAEVIPVVNTVMGIADTAVDVVNFVASGDAAKAIKNGVKVVNETFNNAKKAVTTTLTNIKTGVKTTLKKADTAINKGINNLSKKSAAAGAAAQGIYN